MAWKRLRSGEKIKVSITIPPVTLVKVTGPYSQEAGIIGRIGRLLWAPIAYILGLDFKL